MVLKSGCLICVVKKGNMDLTSENKEIVDKKSYIQLLSGWRFSPTGDPWNQGETGVYWGQTNG